MSNSMDSNILRLEDVHKSYDTGLPNEVEVLHGINLSIKKQEFVALIGSSGSGKSTLLNIIGLLDRPTTGEVYLLGKPTRDMPEEQRTNLRGSSIGFVFQFHYLIKAFSVLENILMPITLKTGKPDKQTIDRARALLTAMEMEKYATRKPDQLSGGQQQRVAIARALITSPALLLADEPTGNLDTKTSEQVFEIFRKFNHEFNCAVLLVTHDPRIADSSNRIITLVDGKISDDSPTSTLR